jgi:hypothetical protein
MKTNRFFRGRFQMNGIDRRAKQIVFCLLILATILPTVMRNHAHAGAVACDIQSSSCVQKAADGMTIEFDIHPKPVTAMSDLRIIVLLSQKGVPVADASVRLDLAMPGMLMGVNRPVLSHMQPGRYEGKAVIVRCPSGKKTWKANIAIEGQSGSVTADFLFEVR